MRRSLAGRLMAAKGHGSPPPLAPGRNCGSGWLAPRKHSVGAAADTFIVAVKLREAVR